MITTLLATGVIGGGSDHPLLGEFRLRYPGFAGVSDQVVVYWMTKAVATVTECWGTDYSDGIMLYAVIQIIKSGALALAGGSAELPVGVTRFKSASMDVAVSEKAANALSDASGYEAEFVILRRRHCGGPRLVGYVEPRGVCWS
jgi:hypothetical protein